MPVGASQCRDFTPPNWYDARCLTRKNNRAGDNILLLTTFLWEIVPSQLAVKRIHELCYTETLTRAHFFAHWANQCQAEGL